MVFLGQSLTLPSSLNNELKRVPNFLCSSSLCPVSCQYYDFRHSCGRASPRAVCLPFPPAPFTSPFWSDCQFTADTGWGEDWLAGPLVPPRDTHLHLLLILEPPLAHDDVFDAPPVTKLLFKDSIIFKEFLGFLLRNSIQGILVDHSHPLKLKADKMVTLPEHSTLVLATRWKATLT